MFTSLGVVLAMGGPTFWAEAELVLPSGSSGALTSTNRGRGKNLGFAGVRKSSEEEIRCWMRVLNELKIP